MGEVSVKTQEDRSELALCGAARLSCSRQSHCCTDEQLMAAVAGGCEQAFDCLFKRHAPHVQNYVRRQLHDDEATADVTQEIFLRLYRGASHFDPSRHFRQWLFTIAGNEVRRYWGRNAQRPVSLNVPAAQASEDTELAAILPDLHERPDEAAEREALGAQVLALIRRLPEVQRQTVLLRAQEKTLAEIAELMHCPLATVSSRLHYAVLKLQSWLAGGTGFKTA
jgi:RNA polymerase sigma-70 factor (ECF subfamily)